MTPREWDEQFAREFSEILSKLDEADLGRLCSMFECYPSYIGEPRKADFISYLRNKLSDLRRGSDAAIAMEKAFEVLQRGGR